MRSRNYVSWKESHLEKNFKVNWAAHCLASEELFLNAKKQTAIHTTFDFIFAVFLGALTFPITIISCILIILIDNQSPIYKQIRIGLCGKAFYIYKLKTMRNPDNLPPKITEPYSQLKDDPRITNFGKILRNSKIDELPQIFNVLKGEMSIVGPRPLPANEISYLPDDFIDLAYVKPGLTGTCSSTSTKKRAQCYRKVVIRKNLLKKENPYGLILKLFLKLL